MNDMIFVGETSDKRLVLFGREDGEYFYREFFKNIENPVREMHGLKIHTLILFLENSLDEYSKKGLNLVLEKLQETKDNESTSKT